ncbi:class I SAM-dependent methyltransferase [Heyndrickxia sp. NPDC080065]|uniref:class I SAM-dependent methyltransferase n=1 Tax=Heyndrickxia sp. NPDC080065 TaxID=3390568 RepID=UPI003CFF9913
MGLSYQDALAYYGVGGAHPGGLSLTKQILKFEKINPSTKILDAGCGTGQTAAYLEETYKCDVTVLDSHPIMLEKAKQRFKYAHLPIKVLRGSVEDLPFADDSFDLIISESVIAFTNINKTLSEYFRVLKKEGILINIDMTAEIPLTHSDSLLFSEVYGISKLNTEEEWLSALHSAGFRKVDILSTDTIFSHLQKNIDQPEFNLSDSIDPQLMDIMLKHQDITTKFSKKIGYRVFRSTR